MNFLHKIKILNIKYRVKSFFIYFFILLVNFEIFDKAYILSQLYNFITILLLFIFFGTMTYLLKKINISYPLLFLLSLSIFIKYFIFDVQIVKGKSMEPTLKEGTIVIIDKITYGISIPLIIKKILPLPNKICYYTCKSPFIKPMDIVVFDFPDPILKNRYWIKRVIAMENDIFEFREKKLFINHKEITFYKEIEYLPLKHSTFLFSLPEELYRYPPQLQFFFLKGIGRSGKVPENSYLILGDNTLVSRDSRIFGFIPTDRIVGKVIYAF